MMMDVMPHLFQVTISFSIMAAIYRVWKGPNDLDRVVSIEYLSVLCIAFVIWYSWQTQEPILMDVAIAMAALSFIGTVSFSKYISNNKEQIT